MAPDGGCLTTPGADLSRYGAAIAALGADGNLMEAMDHHGWAAVRDSLGHADSLRLRDECENAHRDGAFRPAGVGRGSALQIRENIRQDHILWLQTGDASVEQEAYLAKLELLRMALNQKFFLGLFDFEGHFAIYPEGAYYKPHLDQHTETSDRIITVILYLNEFWLPGDGGELKLWTTAGDKEGTFEIIEPRMGTLVCFPSADYWHEVLPAMKQRMSITGWFRRS